jgi:hypothetical protein
MLRLRLAVIVDFEQKTASVGPERTVKHAGRTAGIGGAGEGLAAFSFSVVADDQIAGE